jgi:hypothetical protein
MVEMKSPCDLYYMEYRVPKWIKAVDCESTMRRFNSRRLPINNTVNYSYFLFFFFCKDRETNSIVTPILLFQTLIYYKLLPR